MRTLPILILIAATAPALAPAASLSVFGDVSLHGDQDPSTTSETSLGQLDFFVSEKIDDDTRAVAEVVLEGSPEITVDVERLYLSRDLNDHETVTVGRIHIPVGAYNQTYHHGTILQNFAGRPFYLDFEDGGTSLFRMHGIGVFLHSERMGSDDWGFPVDAGIANAGALDTSLPADERELSFATGGNMDDGAMGIVRVACQHRQGHPFTAGLFVLRDSFMESGSAGTASGLAAGAKIADQQVFGFDLRTDLGPLSLTSEGAHIATDSHIGPDGGSSTAAFAEIFWPFVAKQGVGLREESVDIAGDDPLLSGFLDRQSYDAASLLYRYALSDSNVLKAQITQLDGDAGDNRLWQLQWAFMIP